MFLNNVCTILSKLKISSPFAKRVGLKRICHMFKGLQKYFREDMQGAVNYDGKKPQCLSKFNAA